MKLISGSNMSTAEFVPKGSYIPVEHVTIDCFNKEIARLISSHLRTDALRIMETGDPETAEELLHLYNTLIVAMCEWENSDEKKKEPEDLLKCIDAELKAAFSD